MPGVFDGGRRFGRVAWGTVLCCWLIRGGGMSAEELFVASGGDDRNDGTVTRPLRSVQAARDRLRSTVTGAAAPRIVTLRGGTHRLTSPLVLEPVDGGSAEFPVTYRAYPGEQPVLSGGLPVGDWRIHDALRRIHVAEVPVGTESRDLFVNVRRGVRARSAAGFPGVYTATDTGLHVEARAVADLGGTALPELVMRWEWEDPRVRVMAVVPDGDGAMLVLDPGAWRYLRPLLAPAASGSIRYAENHYSFLDEPGEWYLAGERGRLYYIPREGEDPGTAVAELAVSECLIDIRGEGVGRPVTNLRFEGLGFAGTTWLRPSRHSHVVSQANLVSEWSPEDFYERGLAPESTLPGAAIEIRDARGVRFERCRWTRLGSAGINFRSGSQECSVEGCTFEHLGGAAIHIGEPGERNRDNVNPEDSRHLVRDVTVRNNWIRSAGEEYLGSVGLFVGFADSVTLAHNRLEDLPQSGISVGWGWAWEIHTASRNHRIEFNRLRNVVSSDLNDGGALYTLGAQPGTVVRGNYVRRQLRNYSGLYPDIGTAFLRFEDNVLREVPYWLLIHDPSTVSNTITGNWSSTRHAAINDTGNRITGNRFVDDGHWPTTALAIIHRAGIEPAFADIQPRGVELVTPMDRAEVVLDRTILLSADVFGPPEEIRAVRFLRDEITVAVDTDAADGWNATWRPASMGGAHLTAEVEWSDGTRHRADPALVWVRGGSRARVHVASPAAPETASGLIVIDAVDFSVNWHDDVYAPEWVVETVASADLPGSALRASPDIGWVLDPPWLDWAPRLEYPVRLAGKDSVFAWLLMSSRDSDGAAIRVALDGQDPVLLPAPSAAAGWQWCQFSATGERAVLSPRTEGLHNLVVLMRDDGVGLSRLVLTTNRDFQPGAGPLPVPAIAVEPVRPTLRLTVIDSLAQESPLEAGGVAVVRSAEGGAEDLHVGLRTVGTAAPGVDFDPLPGTLVVPADAAEIPIAIHPRSDAEPESPEEAGVSLEPGETWLLTWPAEARVTLRDASESETAFWRDARFGGAPAGRMADSADPDADGIPNLLEEAFDLDPLGGLTESDRRKLPRAWLGTFEGQACLYFRYYHPFSGRRIPNLRFTVESCADPARGEWREALPDWVGMDLPEYLGGVYPGRHVRMRFAVPDRPDSEPARFFRLAIRREIVR